jgi:hypothetical protein
MGMKNEVSDWQELQSTWISATELEQHAVASLRASLRWRLWLSRAWLIIEALAFVFLGVVVVALVLHDSYPKAALLGIITLFCLTLSAWARREPIVGNEVSLMGMIDLAISRARRSLRLGLTSYVGVVMVFSAIFYYRVPSAENDVFHGPLVVGAIFGAGTVIYHLHARQRLRHFIAMRERLSRREP